MILGVVNVAELFLCCSKMKGSDNQEKLVYQIIEDAGNKGMEHLFLVSPLGECAVKLTIACVCRNLEQRHPL